MSRQPLFTLQDLRVFKYFLFWTHKTLRIPTEMAYVKEICYLVLILIVSLKAQSDVGELVCVFYEGVWH